MKLTYAQHHEMLCPIWTARIDLLFHLKWKQLYLIMIYKFGIRKFDNKTNHSLLKWEMKSKKKPTSLNQKNNVYNSKFRSLMRNLAFSLLKTHFQSNSKTIQNTNDPNMKKKHRLQKKTLRLFIKVTDLWFDKSKFLKDF